MNSVSNFGVNMDVELQQRGVEYSALFKKYDNMRWVRHSIAYQHEVGKGLGNLST